MRCTYYVRMGNLTLRIDARLLAKARAFAAAQGTTVNALIREHLTRLTSRHDRAAQARRELAEMARSEDYTFDTGGWKWNREDLYDRPSLRGHQHPDLRGVAEPAGGFEEDAGDGDHRR
ncbi:MAG: hypothetical protein KIS81_05150 [Maricaulaceae bacterium]|nr:hypothetical protein [Maricaulaceae bacterium]